MGSRQLIEQPEFRAAISAVGREVSKVTRSVRIVRRKIDPKYAAEFRTKKRATKRQKALFNVAFCADERFVIVPSKKGDAYEVWDTRSNGILVTKPSEAQAQQFVDAMGDQ
jgi:hypothetical protein